LTHSNSLHSTHSTTGDKADVDKAVKAAKAAMAGWRKVDASYRGRLLNKLADLIETHKDELAAYVWERMSGEMRGRRVRVEEWKELIDCRIESLDNGKPLKEARDIDVAATANTFRYFAGIFWNNL
jgi:aldehyde dehydrogenase (NAD+)